MQLFPHNTHIFQGIAYLLGPWKAGEEGDANKNRKKKKSLEIRDVSVTEEKKNTFSSFTMTTIQYSYKLQQ